MKYFRRSFICQSTDTGKRGPRNKNSNKNEICKCHASFLKLHYYDCPVARRPCPIHGSGYHHCGRDEKAEKKENMIISFHPSSKTDRLFKPVKNLLAHCNPQTKIHLEYYSPDNSIPKNDTKPRQTKTNSEELKESLSNKVFVEKTNSFETDKTNRMKRLKQCFYSPCNSIVGKTRSQYTLTENINENSTPEEAPYKFCCGKFKCTSSNKLDSSDWEKSSDDRAEPDFVTVTKHSENKILNHKIFEIKHKKGVDDIRFTKLPRETPFVYSAYDIKNSGEWSTNQNVQDDPSSKKKKLVVHSNEKENTEKTEERTKEKELSSSDQSQSSSSGSIYFTSHIFKLTKESATDISRTPENSTTEMPGSLDESKAKDKAVNTVNASTKTENPVIKSNSLDSSSETSSVTKYSESAKKDLLSKTDKSVGSADILSSVELLYSNEELQWGTNSRSRRKSDENPSKRVMQTSNKSVSKSTQVTPPKGSAIVEYGPREDELFREKVKTSSQDSCLVMEETRYLKMNSKKRNSVDVRTEVLQKREVALVYDEVKQIADKIIQTCPINTRNVQVETMKAKKHKSQMTNSVKEQFVQTSFALSDSRSQSNDGESADLDSNRNCITASYVSSVYAQSANKSQMKKSLSDDDLFCDDSANENGIQIHHFCSCQHSETWTSELELNGSGKIVQPKKPNLDPIPQSQNKQTPRENKKEGTCKGEQTYFSDLSELTKMLSQFLSKTNKETSHGGEKIKKELKVPQVISVDSSKLVKKPKTNVADAEAQTIFKVLIQEEEVNRNLSKVLQGSSPPCDEEAIIVCKICHRKIDQMSFETDNQGKPQFLKKEVKFVNAATITEDLDKSVEIVKRSISVSVPDELDVPLRKQILTCFHANDFNDEASTRTPLNEYRTYCDENNQVEKEWSLNITTAPTASELTLRETQKLHSDKFLRSKNETLPQSQPNETSTVKKVQKPDYSWKCTDSILTREAFERKPMVKPRDTKETEPCKSTFKKSGIPTSTDTFRKNINTVSPIAERKAMPVTSVISKVQKDPGTSALWIQKNTVCFCKKEEVTPETSSSRKTNPSTSNYNSTLCSHKPPRPNKLKSNVTNSTTNRTKLSETSPKKPSHKNPFLYPAIIRPVWYSNFRKTLQMIKNFEGQSLQGSNSSILKQKRCREDLDDSPGGKKKKGKDNGSGECIEFKGSIFPLNGETIIDMRNKTGFVWIPSSALRISKSETHPMSFLRSSQSESKLPKAHSHTPNLFSGFNKKPPANIKTVKSCRLKPVQVNEKHPFRKLFEFRLCKSLNFLKNDQTDFFLNENCTFEYEPSVARDENSYAENSNEINWPFSTEMEYKYSEDFTFESNVSSSLPESSDLANDICEAKADDEYPLKVLSPPKSENADSSSEAAVKSKSFDTFWFGRSNWKK